MAHMHCLLDWASAGSGRTLALACALAKRAGKSSLMRLLRMLKTQLVGNASLTCNPSRLHASHALHGGIKHPPTLLLLQERLGAEAR